LTLAGDIRRVYLAGPAVFLPDPIVHGAAKMALCERYGLIGVFPIDADAEPIGAPGFDDACRISLGNEDLIKSCDMVIADMTPYHGLSMDVGTAYEMGFARALGRPVAAYSNCALPFITRARAHFGAVDTDPLGRPQAQGMALEDFGIIDNLMLHGAVHHSGFAIIAEDVPETERYTSLAVFEKLLAALTRR
jgi:nucleoside 2-deoxyribosyltransferase